MKRLISAILIMLILGNIDQIFSLNYTQYNKAKEYLERKGEVYFRFNVNSRFEINKLTDVISLDNVMGNEVYAYANKKGFQKFLEYNLYYEVLVPPGDLLKNPKMSDCPDDIRQDWNKYPTFDAYVDMMYEFESDYPDKCKIIQIGTSGLGRELLYAKISDNVNQVEPEPRHMYTSSMHGDETTLYVNLLRLIDYLLSQYDSDTFVKKLVDNVEIWICPLENPDGTYRNDNSTVQNAQRFTSEGTDLNRHYPDIDRGPHPDGASRYEPECQAVIDLFDTCQFVLSANFHGGAELLNYPYDSWSDKAVDDDWMKYAYRKYVDKVHSINSNYMTGENNGIVQGWHWYEIHGSRMDYVTWFKHCREVTGEMSTKKLMTASSLPNYWDYNYEALLEYIEQCLFGINGTVKDSLTDEPLKAKVFIEDHDEDNSFTFSKLPNGDFWRPIIKGTYSVTFSCDDYFDKTITDVEVNNDEATVLNVKLWNGDSTGINVAQKNIMTPISIAPYNRGIIITYGNITGSVKAAIYDLNGRVIKLFPQQVSLGKASVVWDGLDETGSQVGNGCYLLRLVSSRQTLTKSFVFPR